MRQGFDTANGMRPISLPDAFVIEIQNPSRLPSYAIFSARASRQGVFVHKEFHSVIVVVEISLSQPPEKNTSCRSAHRCPPSRIPL
jgi:hypothetical protein